MSERIKNLQQEGAMQNCAKPKDLDTLTKELQIKRIVLPKIELRHATLDEALEGIKRVHGEDSFGSFSELIDHTQGDGLFVKMDARINPDWNGKTLGRLVALPVTKNLGSLREAMQFRRQAGLEPVPGDIRVLLAVIENALPLLIPSLPQEVARNHAYNTIQLVGIDNPVKKSGSWTQFTPGVSMFGLVEEEKSGEMELIPAIKYRNCGTPVSVVLRNAEHIHVITPLTVESSDDKFCVKGSYLLGLQT